MKYCLPLLLVISAFIYVIDETIDVWAVLNIFTESGQMQQLKCVKYGIRMLSDFIILFIQILDLVKYCFHFISNYIFHLSLLLEIEPTK